VPKAIPVAAVPIAPPSSDLDFSSSPGLTVSTPRPPQPKGPRPWRTTFIVLFSLGGTIALFVYIYNLIAQNNTSGSGHTSTELQKFNCSIKPPPGWKPDHELERDMHVFYALKRKNPNAYLALEVTDYESGYPNKSILIDTFRERLSSDSMFGKDLAWQPKPPASVDRLDKLETLASQPAYAMEFEGLWHGEYYMGECLIVEHRGFVYWFFTFGLQTDLKDNKGQKAWDEVRNNFVFLDQREGWNPQRRSPKVYKGKGYQVGYSVDVWIRPGGKSTDPACDFELFGEDKRPSATDDEEARQRRAGHLHVVLLDKPDGKDAAELLRDHFLKQQVAAGLGKLDEMQLKVMEDRQKKPLESERAFGPVRGKVIKYRLTVTGAPARFVVLASIPRDEQMIGIYADGSFDLRDFWEQEFNSVLDGFAVTR
jgi:hypothetical protein